MKKLLIVSFLSSFLSLAIRLPAQTADSTGISGKVLDAGKQPIENAVVSLLRSRDSGVIARQITGNTGVYRFSGIKPGTYLVNASKTGFAVSYSKPVSVPVPGGMAGLPAIVLSETSKMLSGVTVTAKKAVIETKEDRVIFNVSEDPSLNGQMAIDALRKTPFISVDGDNNILVNGKSNFQVQLNGKTTGLFANSPKEALQGFPANLIDRIEVITSPSAKYDGEGASGILNIITKKKVTGYNGSVQAGYNTLGGGHANANGSLKKGRFGLSGLGSTARMAIEQTGYTDYMSFIPGSVFARRYTDIFSSISNKFMFGNAELSYELDSLKALSLYGNLRRSNSDIGSDNTVSKYDQGNIVLQESLFLNQTNSETSSGDWGIDYTQKYKSHKEKEFSIRFNEVYIKTNSRSDNSQQNSPGTPRYIINDNDIRNVQRTFQVDFALPLSKTSKLEIGSKAILRTANADYESRITEIANTQYKPDPANSNQFNYSQDIYSVYSVYGFKSGKFTFNTGIRAEQTVVKGDFISSGTAVSQHYLTLLPNLMITRVLTAAKRITLSYTKKLARPGINFLNPFVSNQDPLFISYGNTQLGPELIHNFEFRYSSVYKGVNINLALGESIGDRSIESFASFDGATGITSSSYYNIGRNYTTNLSGFINAPLSKKVRVNTNLNFSYRVLSNILDKTVRNSGMGGMGQGSITYTQSSRLNLSVNGGMFFPTVQLQGNSGMFYFYNTSGTYKMAKEKLLLTVGLANFLSKYIGVKNELQTAGFSQETMIYRPGRAMTVSLRYNFGKLKENVSKKKGVTVDDEKQGTQNSGQSNQ
jgi:outer membrane receptor for ferrienterochelin and colicin